MINTFEEATAYISSFIPKSNEVKFSGQFGLDRQRYLLHLLGDPQHSFPCVHITGTSGKSSTSYLVSSILRAAGYRVGLHISPHLVSPCERIQINNEKISEKEFIELLNTVSPHVEAMRDSSYGKPTYFEILVAMTFLAFKNHHVDIAVVEVGLGGRYDGTNVVTNTLVSVITNVGLDHTHVLGDTVEKIIDDKKEIIKPHSIVVSAATQESVKKIIEKKCADVHVPVSFLGSDAQVSSIAVSSQDTVFDFIYKGVEMKHVVTGLLGAHQVLNSAVAIMASIELRKKGFTISDSQIRNALEHATFAGRIDIVRKNPLVVLDGAHNEDKIRALVTTFPKCFSYKKCIVILALKNDKDSEKIIPLVLSIADVLICTKFSKETDMGASLYTDPERLASLARAIDPTKNISVESDPIQAVYIVVSKQDADSAVLITGSLYLVGEIQKAIEEKVLIIH